VDPFEDFDDCSLPLLANETWFLECFSDRHSFNPEVFDFWSPCAADDDVLLLVL